MQPDTDLFSQILKFIIEKVTPNVTIDEIANYLNIDLKQDAGDRLIAQIQLMNDYGLIVREDGQTGIGFTRGADGQGAISILPLKITPKGYEYLNEQVVKSDEKADRNYPEFHHIEQEFVENIDLFIELSSICNKLFLQITNTPIFHLENRGNVESIDLITYADSIRKALREGSTGTGPRDKFSHYAIGLLYLLKDFKRIYGKLYSKIFVVEFGKVNNWIEFLIKFVEDKLKSTVLSEDDLYNFLNGLYNFIPYITAIHAYIITMATIEDEKIHKADLTISTDLDPTPENISDFLEDLIIFGKLYNFRHKKEISIFIESVIAACTEVNVNFPKLPENPKVIEELKKFLTHDLSDLKRRGAIEADKDALKLLVECKKAKDAGFITDDDIQKLKNRHLFKKSWLDKLKDSSITFFDKISKTFSRINIDRPGDVQALPKGKEDRVKEIEELQREPEKNRADIIRRYIRLTGDYPDAHEVSKSFIMYMKNHYDTSSDILNLKEIAENTLLEYPQDPDIIEFLNKYNQGS